jgi:hypothetical protein
MNICLRQNKPHYHLTNIIQWYIIKIMDIIKYQGHKKRTQDAMLLWMKIVSDYNSGKPATQIAQEIGRTRGHVYWVLKKMTKMKKDKFN